MPDTKLIAIAGVIGVGKTTLTDNLARSLNAHVLHEEYGLNPFLAGQFAGIKESALPSELFFLMSRARQLSPENLAPHNIVVADYIFEKNRIFAESNLDKRQLGIYNEIELTVIPHLLNPQYVIYLHDSPANCLSRIISRRRYYEKNITVEALENLTEAYDKLFDRWHKCKLIKINCATVDLRDNATVNKIAEKII